MCEELLVEISSPSHDDDGIQFGSPAGGLAIVSVVLAAATVVVLGLLLAYFADVRNNPAPRLHLISQQVIRLGDVRVDDWLEGHGRVVGVVVLGERDLLVTTANELIMCRTDDEAAVLRRGKL